MDELETAAAGAGPAPSAAPLLPPPPAMPDLAAIVDAWWADHMPGSAVARATEAWNHLAGVLPDLKQRLAAALPQGE